MRFANPFAHKSDASRAANAVAELEESGIRRRSLVARIMDINNATAALQRARITCGDRIAPLSRIAAPFGCSQCLRTHDTAVSDK